MSWQRRTFLGTLAGTVLAACARAKAPVNTSPNDQLNAFMKLSEELTGFSNLDPAIGTVYFQNLRGSTDPRAILECWYSGTYAAASGRATATWTQALAWRACAFTKPPSLCAAPGSWANPPV